MHPDHVAISAARSGGSAKMASLLCDLYAGFNDTQLTEKLREVHKLAVSRESVRLRLPLRRPAVHRRRSAQHRTRRPREAPAGQLLQLDGSPFRSSRGVAQRLRFSARSTMRRRRSSRCISADRRSPRLRHAPAPGVHHLWRTRGALHGDRSNILARTDQHWSCRKSWQGSRPPRTWGGCSRAWGSAMSAPTRPKPKATHDILIDR